MEVTITTALPPGATFAAVTGPARQVPLVLRMRSEAPTPHTMSARVVKMRASNTTTTTTPAPVPPPAACAGNFKNDLGWPMPAYDGTNYNCPSNMVIRGLI